MNTVNELNDLVNAMHNASNVNTKKVDEKRVTCDATRTMMTNKRDVAQVISTGKEHAKNGTHKRSKNSSMHHPNAKDHMITTSSLSTDQKQILLAAIKNIPGAILTEHVAPDCTLLVIDSSDVKGCRFAPRTIKYMLAILRHIPIVSFEWVIECVTGGKWMEYEPYLIDGDEACGQVTHATRKSLRDDNHLFASLQFYLPSGIQQQGSAPTRHDITSVVEAGGGEIVTTRRDNCISLVNGSLKRQSTGPGIVMTVAELFMHVSRYEGLSLE